MGKRGKDLERNGSHLTQYNAKLAEMRDQAAKTHADLKLGYLNKLKNLENDQAKSKEK
jgi:hypothetical protein